MDNWRLEFNVRAEILIILIQKANFSYRTFRSKIRQNVHAFRVVFANFSGNERKFESLKKGSNGIFRIDLEVLPIYQKHFFICKLYLK